MESIFQSPEWEKNKLKTGYQKSYRINNILVLVKELPLGRSMLYSPMVSQIQLDRIVNNESGTRDFFTAIRTVARENRSIFYRLELDIPHSLNTKPKILDAAFGFTKSFEEMQPEHTLILDISRSNEEILSQMKQKGRYNIKVAKKYNITVSSSETIGDELDAFFSLYSQTGKRHSITFRNKSYFETLLEILGQKGYASVYTAWHNLDGKKIPLASAIILYHDGRATYLYGGSSDEYKNYMAPYLMQWQIIEDARKRGCNEYDFFGIAPDDDPKHAWAGVTRFKKNFGGKQLDIFGSYDLIFKPVEYQLFKMAEKIRR